MQHSRLALPGIALAILIALCSVAAFAACSSDEESAQPQQAQTTPAAQANQSAEHEQSSAASSTEEPQAQAKSVETETQSSDEQAESQAQPETDPQKEQAVSETSDQSQPQEADQAAQDTASDQAQSADESVQQEQELEQQQQGEPAAEQPSGPSERERLQMRAEEIAAQATVSDLVGLNAWLNGEETTIALELAKGNIVLVDFWTYSCINCVRTLPFLTAWDEKYRDHGLVIIGVHTPEFKFEEQVDNVSNAIAEHDIEYLVAMDNDYRTWRVLQGSRGFWPRKFLIGPTPDGSPMGVRYDHIGEGDYEETEHQIRAALEAIGRDLSGVPFGVEVAVPDRSDVARGVQTRELYAGWRRNTGGGGPYAGQEEYFLAGLDVEHLYRDVDSDDRVHNLWYVEGLWRAESEAIVHARTTKNLEDYMALIVRARTVNVVLTVAEDGQPYDVFVQFNDDWVQPGFAGEHIQWDGSGRSFIRVNENDLYRLLFFEDFTAGELKLSSNSDQFRIFAFTFGSYVGGE